jgi:hypothetical protein
MDKLSPKRRKFERVSAIPNIYSATLAKHQHAETKAAAPTKKRTVKKPTKADLAKLLAAPLLDETTFPFLELPGEIRNMIFKFALMDAEHSVRFKAGTSKHDGRTLVRQWKRARPGPADLDDIPGQTKGSLMKTGIFYRPYSGYRKSFDVHIFQICRQIGDEAASIFYGSNMFTFEVVPDMFAFLVQFQHRLPLVKKLRLTSNAAHYSNNRAKDMKYGAGYVSYGNSVYFETIFPLLAYATNLEALYLHP